MPTIPPNNTGSGSLFGDEREFPPTWTEGSTVYHTVEKCGRLKEIRKNRRVSGKPGVSMRLCFTCEDIIRTKRSG